MRRIISQSNDSSVYFPEIFAKSRVLEEDITIKEDGVDREYKVGQVDPTYVPEVEAVPLVCFGGRWYHSVHQDITEELLAAEESQDYIVEDASKYNDIIKTAYETNAEIKSKMDADSTYASWLGATEYDPELFDSYEDLYKKSIVPVGFDDIADLDTMIPEEIVIESPDLPELRLFYSETPADVENTILGTPDISEELNTEEGV